MAEFQPPIWLRNAHLQSVLASLRARRPWIMARSRALRAHSKALLLDCGAGVRLSAWHTPHSRADAPLVVLLHGWEGSADSLYVLSAATELSRHGFAIVRLNLRDHGNSHHLNPELFHSCRLSDALGAILAITERFQPRFLGLAGFSLGGNFALRLAADAKDAGIALGGVVAVCPVLDPAVTMAQLENGLFIYRAYFKRKWRASLRKKHALYPEHCDIGPLSQLPTLTAMTDYFVTRHTDYPALADYLAGYALTGERLASISTPSHILIAEDDPIIPARDLTRLAHNPALQITRTRYGGHCGFVDKLHAPSWADRYVLTIFQALSKSR